MLRPVPVIVLQAVAIIVGTAMLLFAMRHADWRGDEYTYHACARAVGDLLAGRSANFSSTWRVVVGTGWFMPGICVLAAPPLAVDPQAPYWLLRGWMWLTSMALAAVLALQLKRRWGPWAVVGLLVFPGLVPLWHMAGLMLLPDLPAGLLVATAVLLATELGTGLLRGEIPSWRKLLALQACLALALYLRGPTLLVAAMLDGGLLVMALAGPARRSAARVLLAALVLPALLAPWSVAASRHFDALVLTTTNVPLVLADGFGDHRRMCRGQCRGDQDVWPAWRWSQAEAERTGENPLTVQRRQMAAALDGLTLREYLAKVRVNVGRFLLDPGETLRTQIPFAHSVPTDLRGAFYHLLLALSLVLYVPFTLVLLATSVLPLGRTQDDRVAALVLKAVTACLFFQPFVHKSSGRYWITFAPLAALALVVLVRHWRRTGIAPEQGTPHQAPVAAWLDNAQVAFGVGFVAVAGVVALA